MSVSRAFLGSAWEAAGETASLFRADEALLRAELVVGVVGADTVLGVTTAVVGVCVTGALNVLMASF